VGVGLCGSVLAGGFVRAREGEGMTDQVKLVLTCVDVGLVIISLGLALWLNSLAIRLRELFQEKLKGDDPADWWKQ